MSCGDWFPICEHVPAKRWDLRRGSGRCARAQPMRPLASRTIGLGTAHRGARSSLCAGRSRVRPSHR
jgi:hypothetical protein